ncbi:hypothetical protein RCL1_004568 [Eukaryota sp. TZLM3-RCL]
MTRHFGVVVNLSNVSSSALPLSMSHVSRFDLLTQPLSSYNRKPLEDVLSRLRELFPPASFNLSPPCSPPMGRVRMTNGDTSPGYSPPSNSQVESDMIRLKWRQKQIDFGKNTNGYQRYISEVPIHARQPHHPRTPPLDLKISKKKWGYMCNNWRRELHRFDTSGTVYTEYPFV